jgi:hypothetical protein
LDLQDIRNFLQKPALEPCIEGKPQFEEAIRNSYNRCLGEGDALFLG